MRHRGRRLDAFGLLSLFYLLWGGGRAPGRHEKSGEEEKETEEREDVVPCNPADGYE